MNQPTRAERLARLFESSKIVASIKDDQGLDRMLASRSRVGFLLYGSIMTLPQLLEKMKAKGKIGFVDTDLIDGLSADAEGVRFLRERIGAAGLLSNRANVVRSATQLGMVGIHRHFMIDSMAFHNLEKQLKQGSPDAVEILPGCIPTVIAWLHEIVQVPLIAGGLIHDENDVNVALAAGASAIATSNPDLWDYQPA